MVERPLAERGIRQIHGVHFSGGHLPRPQDRTCLFCLFVCLLSLQGLMCDTENIEDLLMCTLRQDEYLLGTCFAAFGHDSLNSSRPICSPADTPTQIEQMFDTISYEKVRKKKTKKKTRSCLFDIITLWCFLINDITYSSLMLQQQMPE